MPSASWLNGWLTGDIVTAAEYRKSMGAVFDQTLTIATASIDTGAAPLLPTTYAGMLVEAYLRGDTAATATGCQARFNADATGVYDSQYLQGSAATVTSAELFSQTSASVGDMPAASAAANMFGILKLWIPNYGQAVNHHEWETENFMHWATTTGTMRVKLNGGVWRSTAAINRVALFPAAGNWVTGSRMTVYVMGS